MKGRDRKQGNETQTKTGDNRYQKKLEKTIWLENVVVNIVILFYGEERKILIFLTPIFSNANNLELS